MQRGLQPIEFSNKDRRPGPPAEAYIDSGNYAPTNSPFLWDPRIAVLAYLLTPEERLCVEEVLAIPRGPMVVCAADDDTSLL